MLSLIENACQNCDLKM
jgi:hypothetical protein